jgi:fatty acid CoA ligase FadD9
VREWGRAREGDGGDDLLGLCRRPAGRRALLRRLRSSGGGVDWLIDAGYPLQRISDYHTWLQRFEIAMHALPEQQRQHSLLPLLHNYRKPEVPVCGSFATTERFRSAVQRASIGPDKDIPHIASPLIVKYITNLQLLGLL